MVILRLMFVTVLALIPCSGGNWCSFSEEGSFSSAPPCSVINIQCVCSVDWSCQQRKKRRRREGDVTEFALTRRWPRFTPSAKQAPQNKMIERARRVLWLLRGERKRSASRSIDENAAPCRASFHVCSPPAFHACRQPSCISSSPSYSGSKQKRWPDEAQLRRFGGWRWWCKRRRAERWRDQDRGLNHCWRHRHKQDRRFGFT